VTGAAAALAGGGAAELPGATLAGDGVVVELPQAVTSSALAIASPTNRVRIDEVLLLDRPAAPDGVIAMAGLSSS